MNDVRTELIQIIGEEFNQAGIANEVMAPTPVDGGGEIPAQMLVPLGLDDSGRSPTAHVYFLPLLEQPAVMQYMVLLDYPVEPGAHGDLGRFVNLVNSNLTITGFEFNEPLGQVMFRHSHAIATAPLDPSVIVWPLTMIRDTVHGFGPLVERVAAGGDHDDAATALQTEIAAGAASLDHTIS